VVALDEKVQFMLLVSNICVQLDLVGESSSKVSVHGKVETWAFIPITEKTAIIEKK
jgi:hypothetical protein